MHIYTYIYIYIYIFIHNKIPASLLYPNRLDFSALGRTTISSPKKYLVMSMSYPVLIKFWKFECLELSMVRICEHNTWIPACIQVNELRLNTGVYCVGGGDVHTKAFLLMCDAAALQPPFGEFMGYNARYTLFCFK